MNYQKHYKALVDRAVTHVICGYSERHHVIPKCLGGDESDVNIVRLTPEEHYLAHQLLVKINPGNIKLLWAALAMAGGSGRQKRNNKLHGWLRRQFAEAIRTSSTGRKHSEATKQKLRDSHIGMVRNPHTEKAKIKMSMASVGRKKSPTHIANMVLAKTGKKLGPRSEATKQKISESNKIALRDFSYMATPEYRQMQSEKMKQVWAARKLNLLRA